MQFQVGAWILKVGVFECSIRLDSFLGIIKSSCYIMGYDLSSYTIMESSACMIISANLTVRCDIMVKVC